MDSKDYVVKKLNEDDILEILLEHFPEINDKNTPLSRGILLGEPRKNLRFVGIYGREEDFVEFRSLNLKEIDAAHDFTGDHSFLEKNPQFLITKDNLKDRIDSFKRETDTL